MEANTTRRSLFGISAIKEGRTVKNDRGESNSATGVAQCSSRSACVTGSKPAKMGAQRPGKEKGVGPRARHPVAGVNPT